MIQPPFVNKEIYHIYNRGVEKRDVFLEDKDYLRMIHDLFEFNDLNPPPNLNYHIGKKSIQFQSLEVGLPKIERVPRKLLVDLFAFCLMPNHYHLLVRQRTKGGITLFMRKIGTGYTNYFNDKNKRVGPLFQGKFKAVTVTKENYFYYLPHYIHLNPLDLKFPEWRQRSMSNHKNVLQYLKNYRWSSYLDYIGIKNFPSVTQRDFIINLFGGTEKYIKDITYWLKETNIDDLGQFTFE